MNKENLRKIIEDNSSFKGKLFDYFIQILIFVSLIAFAVETLPDNSKQLILLLNIIELISVIVFSIEYLLRIYVSKSPLKYIFSFYGIIDLLAILPFYLNVGLDLRSLRSFRIFRIFRALKIVRYNKALKRFGVAAKIVKEEVVLFLIIIMILIFIVSSGIYYFENEAQPETFKSIPHSFWWTIVTLTTVGYGDISPVTPLGQFLASLVMILGYGVIAVPTGIVSAELAKTDQKLAIIDKNPCADCGAEGHQDGALQHRGRRQRRRLGGSEGRQEGAAADLRRSAEENEEDRRGLPGRAGHRSRHHGAGLLQRQPAPGHQGRRPHRRPGSEAHHQRADRGRAGLRPGQEGR